MAHDLLSGAVGAHSDNAVNARPTSLTRLGPTMSQTASNRFQRTTALIAMALLGVVGCPPERSSNVEDAVLVGARGMFDRQQGVLSVSVSPKDAAGNFVGQNLPESAFRFEDVTMRRALTTLSPIAIDTVVSDVTVSAPNPDAQLTGVVVFDSSGSMSSNDPGAIGRRRGGNAMFDILRDGDRLAVLDFGAGVTPGFSASRQLTDFTGERDVLDAALLRLTESGGTPLFASTLDALGLLDPDTTADIEETALVLLTDGQASDGASLTRAIQEAQRLSVPVFAIGLGRSLDFTSLSRLAEETNGTFIEAADAMALEQAFAGVSSGLRLGAVSVEGTGTYATIPTAGRYEVTGILVTIDGSASIETPFAFTVDVQ